MITIPVDAEKLKELRRERKVLQMEVEKACGIPYGRLSQYETGRSGPTPIFLEQLSSYFKTPAKDIIDKEKLNELKADIKRLAAFVGAKVRF
jgi:transcriptional regulator with XRE-family HTH domain